MNSWEFQIDWSCGHGDMTQTNQGIFWLFFENRHFSRRLFCWPISITSSFSINLVNTLFESLEPVLLTQVTYRTIWPLMCLWLVSQNQVVVFDRPRTQEWSNHPEIYPRQKYSFSAFQQGIDEICRLTGSTRNWRANSASSKFTFFRKIVKVYPDFREP